VTVSRALGRRLARLATNAVVRNPRLWRIFRALLRRQFDRLAPRWDGIIGPAALDAFRQALETVPPPRRALDLGTGTGAAAFAIAERFPAAEVIGVDLAPAMVEAAAAKTPAELAGRITFLEADASALPLPDGSCELVSLANMIPFFAELERVLAPGGAALFSFAHGPATPIFVPPKRLRMELSARGFSQFADFTAGAATCLVARKR